MCNTVYITHRRFNRQAADFSIKLAEELRRRKIEVEIGFANDIFNFLSRPHKTYGIAIAIDFFKEGEASRGITINKRSSLLTKHFIYTLSTFLDSVTPILKWRELNFVSSDDCIWFKFFNKISSEVKFIYHPCVYKNSYCEEYLISFEKTIHAISDEVIRCLRSDCDYDDYRKRVRIAKTKSNKYKN